MNIENLEELKENLYRKGFGTGLNAELEQQMQSGKPEFMLEHFAKVKEDEVGFKLHFRHDEEKDKVYFNRYDAGILKNADAPGEIREHTFPTEKLITAMEAYRMLKHGELVSVNKTLFNKDSQQYNTWINLDTKGEKDERNNYPVNTYHQNYYKKEAFVLKDALKNVTVPVKEFGNAQILENIEKALKKANLPQVTIKLGGEETTGYLSVNPKAGRVDVYDKNMQLIENQQQSQQQSDSQKNAAPVQKQEDVKKKSNQQVTWQKKDQPRKGMSW